MRFMKRQKAGQGCSKKSKPFKARNKYKMKNHKGLMKRVVIEGPRWNRRFLFRSAGLTKKRYNKRRPALKRMKQKRYISKADMKRVRRMLPYFKKKKIKISF